MERAGVAVDRRSLTAPVTVLRGVGPAVASRLTAAGIRTLGELLHWFPRRSDAITTVTGALAPHAGALVRLDGTVADARRQFLPGRRALVRVRLRTDAGEEVELTWFNQPWLLRSFVPGTRRAFTGRLEAAGRGWRLVQPRVAAAGEPAGPVRLQYPEIDGIGDARLRRWIAESLATADLGPLAAAPVPPALAAELPPWPEALRAMHAPASLAEHERARRSFALREAVELFRAVERARRARARRRGFRVAAGTAVRARIRARIPFAPTAEQQRAIDAILQRLAGPAPAGVLLQGDVGSGKTAVALAAALAVVAAGAQVAFLAPTELLAEQQFDVVSGWLAGSRIAPLLLTAGVDAAARRAGEARLRAGEAALVFGTHALLTERVAFAKLGLVVVDEQHRFGVEQRSALVGKGRDPHLLVMSATPIPRTLALARFGDLDLVTLHSRPGDRSLPPAVQVAAKSWPRVLRAIARHSRRGGRVYVVAPAIDGDGAVPGAVALHRQLARRFRAVLVHGQQPARERRAAVAAFRAGEVELLVGTTVLEVGVDVPEATLIVITGPERFGLATLHQLRGRVGRGARRGLCIVAGERTPRVDALCRSRDGFALAEADLRLRGAGEIFGVRQSGRLDLRAFDPVEDLDLLLRVRDAVRESPGA